MELAQVYMSANVIELEPVNDIDLSSLASIVECRNVREQQSYVKAVEGASFLSSGTLAVTYPFESDFKNLARAEIDTDTDGN